MNRLVTIFSIILSVFTVFTLSPSAYVLAGQDPCKLLTRSEIESVVEDFGFKKFRYVDGRDYFTGQSCEFFGDGKTVTLTVEEKEDFAGGKNLFDSARDKLERQKKAARPGILQQIQGIGEEALWDGNSLEFLKNGCLYTLRVHATKGMSGKSGQELKKIDLEYSKAIAKIVLSKIQ